MGIDFLVFSVWDKNLVGSFNPFYLCGYPLLEIPIYLQNSGKFLGIDLAY